MKKKREISSGGIVYKKEKGQIYILIIKDPKNKWTFPKGLIEKQEDAFLTAKREIKEETAVDEIIYRKNLGFVTYRYLYEQTLVYKKVYYFLFELKKKPVLVPQKEEGIKEVKFINLKKAEEIINYQKTNGSILNKVQAFFAKKEKGN